MTLMIQRATAMMIPTNPPKVKRLLFSIGLDDSVDLLTEILLRLPVKSLSRFKSVCKRWQSIISSDYFCHQHTLRRPRLQPSLILQVKSRDFFYLTPTTNGGMKIIPYRWSAPLRGCTIEVACNGLMLLQSPGGCYYVHNLTTRRSRKIDLNRNNKHPRFAGIGLAFDPSKSPYYKIVCIYPKGDPSSYYELMTSYQIEVYDSESHSWKPGMEAAFVPKLAYFTGGTHWNNKIYWLSRIGCCYFDIDKNEMKTLSSPETTGRDAITSLCESNGHLYYCEDESTQSAVVWELVGKDDGPTTTTTSPWLLKHHAPVDQYSCIVGFMAGSDGDETSSLLTHRGAKMIRVYSFRVVTHEDLIDLTTQPCYKRIYDFSVTGFQFGETLALV